MRYTANVQVRSYEVGADGLLHHAHIARFVLHAGNLVTNALGMGAAWYEAEGTFFVVRGLHLEFESGAREDEALTLTTWLSEAQRVRGRREVALASALDGRAIAHAQLDWVYVDRATLGPARMPADMVERLKLEDAHACREAWALGQPVGASSEALRAAQHHELDQLQHLNSAVYVEWFEQAWCEATGRTPAGIRGHQLEFLRQVTLGEPMSIVTQATDTGVWSQEIRHADTGELRARNWLAAR
jgi:acyl-CoA thioester hydrolase